MFVRLFCQNSAFKRKPNHFVHYTALILTVFILLNNEEQRKDLVIILASNSSPQLSSNADAVLPVATQQEVPRDTCERLKQKGKTQVS